MTPPTFFCRTETRSCLLKRAVNQRFFNFRIFLLFCFPILAVFRASHPPPLTHPDSNDRDWPSGHFDNNNRAGFFVILAQHGRLSRIKKRKKITGQGHYTRTFKGARKRKKRERDELFPDSWRTGEKRLVQREVVQDTWGVFSSNAVRLTKKNSKNTFQEDHLFLSLSLSLLQNRSSYITGQ